MALRTCTFGVRIPLDNQWYADIIKKEKKYDMPFTPYNPNYESHPLTSKFYARHDHFKAQNKEQLMHVEDSYHHIRQYRARGPLCKYSFAITENQEYGWYCIKPIIYMDRNDKRFYRPLNTSHEAKIQGAILTAKAQAKEAEFYK